VPIVCRSLGQKTSHIKLRLNELVESLIFSRAADLLLVDMSRNDYNGLQRSSRIIEYGTNWLEHERTVKTIESDDLGRHSRKKGANLVCAAAGF
jgi:hypothetical protein